MPGKFEIKKAKNGQFFFHLMASNGEIILASEQYKAKPSCKNGIASVQRNAGNDARYERKTGKSGKFFFVLKAGNHEIIGNSEQYDTEKNRDKGIESVKKNAPDAKVVDLTAATARTSAASA